MGRFARFPILTGRDPHGRAAADYLTPSRDTPLARSTKCQQSMFAFWLVAQIMSGTGPAGANFNGGAPSDGAQPAVVSNNWKQHNVVEPAIQPACDDQDSIDACIEHGLQSLWPSWYLPMMCDCAPMIASPSESEPPMRDVRSSAEVKSSVNLKSDDNIMAEDTACDLLRGDWPPSISVLAQTNRSADVKSLLLKDITEATFAVSVQTCKVPDLPLRMSLLRFMQQFKLRSNFVRMHADGFCFGWGASDSEWRNTRCC